MALETETKSAVFRLPPSSFVIRKKIFFAFSIALSFLNPFFSSEIFMVYGQNGTRENDFLQFCNLAKIFDIDILHFKYYFSLQSITMCESVSTIGFLYKNVYFILLIFESKQALSIVSFFLIVLK
jgi:hypothetical protein